MIRRQRRWCQSVIVWSLLKLLLLYLLLFVIVASLSENDNENGVASTEQERNLLEIETHSSQDRQGDIVQDGMLMLNTIASDPSCEDDAKDTNCWQPPESTIETTTTTTEEERLVDATCVYGGDDPFSKVLREEEVTTTTTTTTTTITVDKHWGSDQSTLKMRDRLRTAGWGNSVDNTRPPIFLMPGLASTRLVAWRHKSCPHHPLLSDIKVQDNVWLNINLILQMGTINVVCMKECMKLGWNQTDAGDWTVGCKLRPDEGLDAISSLAPGGLGSSLLVGGTNTVYAWLIQWLADNLGYDVGNIVGLPYDWRLSPDRMEQRDGFLTLTRHKIEAAVKSNGQPGIMVAHSMGNTIFRYFLEWLRQSMREEAYAKYIEQTERRDKARKHNQVMEEGPGWAASFAGLADEWWNAYFAESQDKDSRRKQLWELAEIEGDENYVAWLEKHIWTYVGLSAPILGAVNPMRAVISGENMGLPMSDEAARDMELTFGCTNTVLPISSKLAFCDEWDAETWDEEPQDSQQQHQKDLFCLDDLMNEIEDSRPPGKDSWADFPVLKNLLKDRVDWDSGFPMVSIVNETCQAKERTPCAKRATTNLGPRDAGNGELFATFSRIWREEGEPLVIKREQLEQSWWNTNVPNILNKTWDRPHIKHVIMAYGVDLPTEAGYVYKKTFREGEESTEPDGVPTLERVIWEEPNGKISVERLDVARGTLDSIVKKKVKREPLQAQGRLQRSGDGTIPYLSLSWAHTWLLHGIRAQRYTQGEQPGTNALDDIDVSHRPKGAMEWIKGAPTFCEISTEDKTKQKEDSDTGTTHPHGTKYKPEMVRYHNVGQSRKTGMKYSTTVIEAFGVEHKETTRNYDILAGVFTDVLKQMHDDFNLA